MSSGRRYDYDNQKLNMKKVFATILVFLVIIMVIVSISKAIKKDSTGKVDSKKVTNSYLTVYTNEKWGVINSKGEYVIDPTYENMIIIPNSTSAVFLIQSDVDLENGSYKSYAVDADGNKLYSSYEQVEAMQNIDKYNQIIYDNNVLKVSKDGKFGLINYNGKELLSCIYDNIYPLEYVKNSFVTIMDGKKGLVDNGGDVIIDNRYQDIQSLTDNYENGYVVKNENELSGLIDYKKKQLLECKYSKIEPVFGSGLYAVEENGNKEIVDSEGNIKLSNKFDECINISNNRLLIKKDNKYGIIDVDGNEIIPIEYQDMKYAFEDNYIAEKEDKYGIINISKETKLPFEYKNIIYMKDESFIEADLENGQTNLITTNFETKTTGIVSEINSTLGYIKVRVNDDYKYYNFRLEEQSIKDIYPANTLYKSKENGKYGYVDKNGVVVVNYIYDDATEQNEYGYSAIKKDGKWGAIDSTGKVIVEPSLELKNNLVINFISKWHLATDWNANYYTDVKE